MPIVAKFWEAMGNHKATNMKFQFSIKLDRQLRFYMGKGQLEPDIDETLSHVKSTITTTSL